MRKTLAIARMNLSRLVRDRTAAFFVFVFPFMIILVLGATFGAGFTPNLGVVSIGNGDLGADLVHRLEAEPGLEVISYHDVDALRDAVERGALEGGLAIPDDYDESIRDGVPAPLSYLARPTGAGQQLRLTVEAAVDAQAVEVTAARIAVAQGAEPGFSQALTQAAIAAQVTPEVTVETRAGASGGPEYSLATGAAQELVLFVFVTSLSASTMLIQSRRLGCSRRMLASPTSVRTVLAGEALGRYLIALGQALLIVAGTVALFHVQWGDLATTSLTIALLAACATGAAMLMGAALENEQQAGALGVFLGLALAALGGAMVPLELFPPVMDRIAHLTPHAWAIEALDEGMAGRGPSAVLTNLVALSIYAAALLAIATVAFRRSITSNRS
jgi:ABC-2 type transport system permease protein